jgi:hypothetical protein
MTALQTDREGSIIIVRSPQVRDLSWVVYLTAADNSCVLKTG